MMKKSNILTEAAEIRDFININHNLPKHCTIENTQLSIYSTVYLISRVIADTNKGSMSLVAIKKPSHAVSWATDIKILKADYLDMVSRFNKYCKEHKQAPAYVIHNPTGSKVGFELFVYCLAKIAAFYKENAYLPNYCIFNSKEFTGNAKAVIKTDKSASKSTSSSNKPSVYISKPHMLTNNLGQDTSYNCACNMLQQLFYKLTKGKIIISEKTIAAWAGTTSRGTDHQGINTAIQKFAKTYNLNLKTTWKYYSDFGSTTAARMKAIGELLNKPNVAVGWHILYCDSGEKTTGGQYGHYEVIDRINPSTKYVRALNSLGTKKSNGAYTGRLQDRKYEVQEYYARHTPANQRAILIITRK
jgi:hypothetical protein